MKKTKKALLQIEDLRIRLDEAQAMLSAIRRGEVDGFAISGPEGPKVFTLEGAESSYRFFIESMNEGAVTLSFDAMILYCNNQFAEMVQVPYQKIIGDSIYRFISSRTVFETAFQKAKTEKTAADIQLQREHNEPMPASVSFNPIIKDDIPAICMVISDLTERAHQQELLKERAEQLARLSLKLTLSEHHERQRIAEILHDHLQQLLVAAKIGQEILISRIDSSLKPEAEHILNLISKSIVDTRSLSAELSPPVLQFGNFTDSLEWLVRWTNQNHHIEVKLKLEEQINLERKDLSILLFQSVRELLLNVTKHAGVKSAELKMSHNNGCLKITVKDEGKGFRPEAVWKNAKSNPKFGLISIRERLSHLGGLLEIESAPHAGAIISLIVPLVARRPTEGNYRDFCGKTSEISLSVPDRIKKSPKKIRVMLVDDHLVVREGLSRMLYSHSDLDVVGEASNGEEAIELSRELIPDVILMDVNMPKMSGLEATRIIHSELPHIRIIGLSMYDEDDQAEAMLNVGASAYLSKSGETDHLLTEIRAQK